MSSLRSLGRSRAHPSEVALSIFPEFLIPCHIPFKSEDESGQDLFFFFFLIFIRLTSLSLTCSMQGLCWCCAGSGSWGTWASAVVAHKFSSSVACGILVPLTRDQTRVPCIARWTLNHGPTREVPRQDLRHGRNRQPGDWRRIF